MKVRDLKKSLEAFEDDMDVMDFILELRIVEVENPEYNPATDTFFEKWHDLEVVTHEYRAACKNTGAIPTHLFKNVLCVLERNDMFPVALEYYADYKKWSSIKSPSDEDPY
jgi:hypothetical protein